MAWILTLIGEPGTPVNIQVSEQNTTAQQALHDLFKTPERQWATVDAIVDGQPTPVYIRPDRYGMIFLHWRDDIDATTSEQPSA